MSGKKQVTHIEIRRVQNGFIVTAIDLDTARNVFSDNPEHAQRAVMVASNADELGTILKNVIDSGDMEWLPTMDLPVLAWRDDTRRQQQERERTRQRVEYEKAVANMQKAYVNPSPYTPPGVSPSPFGGVLGGAVGISTSNVSLLKP
jgi:hypothetical protein